MSPIDQEHIAYWLERGQQATVGTVAFDKFHQPIVAILDECKVTPKGNALDEAEALLNPA